MEAAYRRTALILFVLFVVLILYGSFYPFRLDLEYAKVRYSAPMDYWLVSDAPTSKVDILFNTLAYMPIGILLTLILPARWSFLRGLAVATLSGGFLSLVIEIGQNAFRMRYATLIDFSTNTLGTAIGFALAAWLLRSKSAVFRSVLSGLTQVPFAAWALLLLWGALHAAPFVPSGFYKLRMALRYLSAWEWNVAGIAKWLAAWLILITVLRRLAAPRYFLAVFVGLALVSPPVRLLIRGQSLGPNEIIALGLALPFLAFKKPHVAMWTVLAGLLISGLAPFEFQGARNAFAWMPFGGVLEADPDRSFLPFIEKAYLYLGAVWLVFESGLAEIPSGVAVAVLLAIVEVGQIYLPGRTPEVTDPIMALLTILVLIGHRAERNELNQRS